MSKHILLTDDDELVLIAMGELMNAEGYEVETACSGQDGLNKAAATQFDLVVLDVIMPGMQGFDVCRALRRMEAYQDVPIIMLTAKSGEADRRRGLEAGASFFLPKPIDPMLLLDKIQQALGAGQP